MTYSINYGTHKTASAAPRLGNRNLINQSWKEYISHSHLTYLIVEYSTDVNICV